MSPASRAVVVLFYLHEMSLAEAAAVLEIPVGTAKSRLAYGLQVLRRNAALHAGKFWGNAGAQYLTGNPLSADPRQNQ